jgi:hypothetical protein
MKNFNMGQKSLSYTCASKIAKFSLIILTISALRFNAGARSTESTPDCPSVSIVQVSSNDPIAIEWYVTVNLSCAIGGGEVSTTSQFGGQNGFDGFSDETLPAINGMSITYHLSGPSSTLPANVDVAVISVIDDDCGEVHHYQVSTDGGGTMLILDEF